MINLHFHWAWIPFVVVLLIGIIALFCFLNDDDRGPAVGLSVAVGCGVFLIAIVVALVIGGIWLCCEQYHVLSEIIDEKTKLEKKLTELLEQSKTLTEKNLLIRFLPLPLQC